MTQHGPAVLRAILILAILGSATAGTAWAQDERQLGWAETAGLTVVFTGGNAESSTLGLTNVLSRTWETATFLVETGALRADSGDITRTAVGTPQSFQVNKDSVSRRTAESYYTRGRYSRDINPRTFWYGGTGWERNTFAGIDNRYSWGGGLGSTWSDDEQSTFKTYYGVTITRQDDVVDVPGSDDTFAGLNLSYDYRRQVTANTEFTSVLVVDENLEDTGDFRTSLINALAVSMSNQLALKVSWQMLYDHQPSLVGLSLVGTGGVPTGDVVFTGLDTVDTQLTFAVVANF